MPASVGEPRKIYEVEADTGLLVEGWSQDSRRVILARSKQNGPKLEWVPAWVPVEGGAPHAIETTAGFRLHPNGKRIVSIKGDLGLEFWTLQNLRAALRSSR